jgi:DNA polymerase-4
MIIMHIDANSAYLAWTAAALLQEGYPVDLRTVPAVIAGDPNNRHGIILARSIPCKKAGVATGESLYEAKKKCPNMIIMPPNYNLYISCSEAMYKILSEYSPLVQRYSIDECFLDYTDSEASFGDPVKIAYEIKDRIKNELGFTVNIGVSTNKLLAKMASELKKPDRVHTIWPSEIEKKMWPLPVRDLFMVGGATERKLRKININTIGDLAKADPAHMRALLKSHGQLIWDYANGRDNAPVVPNSEIEPKGMGNSTTISYDVVDRDEALKVLLALVERVSMRIRKSGYLATLVSVSIKTDEFLRYSHQVKLSSAIETTSEIYDHVCKLFDRCWRGEPIRHLGVSVSGFTRKENQQLSFFDKDTKDQSLDETVDLIRKKYGEKAIMRATFANGEIEPLQGGTNDGEYIMMGGYGCEDISGTD